MLRPKSNKKVLLAKSNKNDRNQQINNNNNLITLMKHQYHKQKDALVQALS